MAYLLAGPFVALVGIMAIFFVLRRKSVEKRSMYSARRSQIEHKVRAARQRTLAPHGHSQSPPEETIPAGTTFAQPQAQSTVAYEAPAYEPPPAAPPAATPFSRPQESPAPAPWDVPAAPSAAPSSFDYPPAAPEPQYTPPQPEPFRPAPEPTPMPAPSEPAWTPAPRPSEPAAAMEPAASAASVTAAGSWSVVSTNKESTEAEPDGKKKKKDKGEPGSAWQLSSGEAPGLEADEPEVRRSSGTLVAVAQYAVLVVGLVMVLIGVLVMVANAHVT